MELYQQDVLSRLEDGCRITQFTLLQRETSLGGNAADNAADRLSVSEVSDEDTHTCLTHLSFLPNAISKL